MIIKLLFDKCDTKYDVNFWVDSTNSKDLVSKEELDLVAPLFAKAKEIGYIGKFDKYVSIRKDDDGLVIEINDDYIDVTK